ncbi:MAG: beta-glucosidase BglX [Ruminococcaceae bacterium]|nr:beta-glucosidase BglX [Oscillospiraceae bacterium]
MSDVDLRHLLSQMTFEEKIGQLMQYNTHLFTDSTAEITGPLTDLGLDEAMLPFVGSVLNFEDAAQMRAIQQAHLQQDRLKIPMLFMMDVIHGYRTVFPIPLALSGSFDPELVRDCSAMAAKEAAASGVHVTFTPMVDLSRDARWGRVMEGGGEDPLLTAVMGVAQVQGFQGDDLRDTDRIAACVKHFAAYGAPEAGRDYYAVELSERLLRERYFPAYRACIEAGAPMVMASFNTLNGIPAVANEWLMNDILRGEWGFDGVVISDYDAVEELCVHGVAADKKDAAKQAMRCGCDIEMCSAAYASHLKELTQEGVLTTEQIDAAVLRVLMLKDRLGLFEDPYRGASTQKEQAVCLSPAHRALARKAAQESAVLLKNNGVLPLSEDVQTVAVIGPFADSRDLLGAWSLRGDTSEGVTVSEGLAARLPHARILTAPACSNLCGNTDQSGFEAALTAAENADAVVLCLGEPSDYSGEGSSRATLDLPGAQLTLAREVIRVNPRTAVVLFGGRPLALTELDAVAPAILHMWFPGHEGGNAVASLLLGDENPSGKLAMSFPKTVGQCPLSYDRLMSGRPIQASQEDTFLKFRSNYIDSGNLPLYPFGYGLSYSRFEYESLTLDRRTLTADGTLTVTVTVFNNSDRHGKEVVQLYMRDLVASVARPVQQLIAFDKIALAPFERKSVSFTVREEMLRFVDARNHLVSEAGEFEVSTGYADHLLLTERFSLQ